MTGRPKLAASVIAALILSAPMAFPANRRAPSGNHRGRGSELQRRAANGRDGFPVQSIRKAAGTGADQRARPVRLRPPESGSLFGSCVAGQLRAGGEAKDRRAAGHAKPVVCRPGKRLQLHRTGIRQTRRRRFDERRLEVGAEGIRRDTAGFEDIARQQQFRSAAVPGCAKPMFSRAPRACSTSREAIRDRLVRRPRKPI